MWFCTHKPYCDTLVFRCTVISIPVMWPGPCWGFLPWHVGGLGLHFWLFGSQLTDEDPSSLKPAWHWYRITEPQSSEWPDWILGIRPQLGSGRAIQARRREKHNKPDITLNMSSFPLPHLCLLLSTGWGRGGRWAGANRPACPPASRCVRTGRRGREWCGCCHKLCVTERRRGGVSSGCWWTRLPSPTKTSGDKDKFRFLFLHHHNRNLTWGFSFTCPHLSALWTVSPAGRTGAVRLDPRAAEARRWPPPTRRCCAASRTGAGICEPKWSCSGFRPVLTSCWEQRGCRTSSTSRILVGWDGTDGGGLKVWYRWDTEGRVLLSNWNKDHLY